MKNALVLVAAVLVLGCGTSKKTVGDTAEDPDVTPDEIGDTAPDTHEDTVEDTPAETVEDTTGDPVEDTVEDTATDPGHDTATDPGSDPGTDPGHDSWTDPPFDTPIDVVTDVPLDMLDGWVGCVTDMDCMSGLNCCGGRCVNLLHDPAHCSACGSACPPSTPFCDTGSCTRPPCDPGTVCIGIMLCCGLSCCASHEVCCEVDGPGPSFGPACYDYFCPGGCPLCP